ncbi:MAG: hypothetical protein JWP97_2533, partial [Labilithrix sp.]|nr:hypothetical protein [Labilithrix sp.]
MDATARFSGRSNDYVKTRPAYPPAAFAILRVRCG